MSERHQYRKRPDRFVLAVRLDLDTPGFAYKKWDGEQRCKAGDWIVDNDGDVYTVDQDTFARTYRQVGPGRWIKSTPVWAEVASEAGTVKTKEGSTRYEPGDYLVFNERDGGDAYAISGASSRACTSETSDDRPACRLRADGRLKDPPSIGLRPLARYALADLRKQRRLIGGWKSAAG